VETAISITGLVKRFGDVTALDGLDLEVATGEVHGFLGPNGSGKSTTIRVLLGLLRADAGEVRLLGGDPWREAVALHRRLAYVPGEVSLWPNLTGGEVIDLLGRMRGGIDEARRSELLDRFELDPSKRCRSYSKGNRQKVGLVAALCADVELLLLDEPTAGLDPVMEAEFQEVVREEVARGRTILLSSHILAEAESLSDRISIIRAGRTVASGTLAELRGLTQTTVVARLHRPEGVAGIPGLQVMSAVDSEISAEADSERLSEVMAALAGHGIESLVVHPPTLEELFLRHYDEPGGLLHRRGAGTGGAR
jgi:ABC-2 type transport system ATP-binding protein